MRACRYSQCAPECAHDSRAVQRVGVLPGATNNLARRRVSLAAQHRRGASSCVRQRLASQRACDGSAAQRSGGCVVAHAAECSQRQRRLACQTRAAVFWDVLALAAVCGGALSRAAVPGGALSQAAVLLHASVLGSALLRAPVLCGALSLAAVCGGVLSHASHASMLGGVPRDGASAAQ